MLRAPVVAAGLLRFPWLPWSEMLTLRASASQIPDPNLAVPSWCGCGRGAGLRGPTHHDGCKGQMRVPLCFRDPQLSGWHDQQFEACAGGCFVCSYRAIARE